MEIILTKQTLSLGSCLTDLADNFFVRPVCWQQPRGGTQLAVLKKLVHLGKEILGAHSLLSLLSLGRWPQMTLAYNPGKEIGNDTKAVAGKILSPLNLVSLRLEDCTVKSKIADTKFVKRPILDEVIRGLFILRFQHCNTQCTALKGSVSRLQSNGQLQDGRAWF